jgi:protein-tyrosine phosphatase
MIDLHSHLLPAIDDGSTSSVMSLQMAQSWVEQGVTVVACTPHILPGVYPNSGPAIREAVATLQDALNVAGIPLKIVAGADNHIAPTFVADLKRGHLLTLADTRYVLVEPPHHVAPARLEDLFHEIQASAFEPILTHPERLSWVSSKYDIISRLAERGVLMQLTSGSITGRFGGRAKALATRMLQEKIVHIIATDAHNMTARPPDLLEGWRAACDIVGKSEADNLVLHRPLAILNNSPRSLLPSIAAASAEEASRQEHERPRNEANEKARDGGSGGLRGRLRRLFS